MTRKATQPSKGNSWTVQTPTKGRKLVTAAAERDGRRWLVRVDGRPGLLADATRLEQAEGLVRDLVASHDGIARDSFDVRVRASLPDHIDEALDALAHVRTLESIGVAIARALAVELVRDEGLVLRDAGQILGVSHQRVAQLLEEHDAWGGDKRPGVGDYVAQLDAWADRKEVIRVSVDADPAKNAAAVARLQEPIGKT